jgi:hypothetical protein
MMLQPVRRPLPMLVTDAAWSRENADTSHIAARPRSYRMLNADDSALIIAYQTIVDVRVGESEFAWDTQRESLRDTRTCIVATLGLSDADSAALSEALHDAQALLTASGCSLGGLRRKKRDPQHQGVESIERDFYWLALRCFEAMNPYEIAARDDVKPSVVKKGISRALSSVGLVSTWKAGAPPRKRQKPRIKHA